MGLVADGAVLKAVIEITNEKTSARRRVELFFDGLEIPERDPPEIDGSKPDDNVHQGIEGSASRSH